jgi:hypothetical protein
MNQISAKLAELLLGSGDHTGNLGPLVGQRRHDVTFRHIHPRSQNNRGDYLLQADMMSAMRLVFMRHDTVIIYGATTARQPQQARLQYSSPRLAASCSIWQSSPFFVELPTMPASSHARLLADRGCMTFGMDLPSIPSLTDIEMAGSRGTGSRYCRPILAMSILSAHTGISLLPRNC